MKNKKNTRYTLYLALIEKPIFVLNYESNHRDMDDVFDWEKAEQ